MSGLAVSNTDGGYMVTVRVHPRDGYREITVHHNALQLCNTPKHSVASCQNKTVKQEVILGKILFSIDMHKFGVTNDDNSCVINVHTKCRLLILKKNKKILQMDKIQITHDEV